MMVDFPFISIILVLLVNYPTKLAIFLGMVKHFIEIVLRGTKTIRASMILVCLAVRDLWKKLEQGMKKDWSLWIFSTLVSCLLHNIWLLVSMSVDRWRQ